MSRRRKRTIRARNRKSDTSRIARAGRVRWLRRNKPTRHDRE